MVYFLTKNYNNYIFISNKCALQITNKRQFLSLYRVNIFVIKGYGLQLLLIFALGCRYVIESISAVWQDISSYLQ
jgi:hypothetical protein